MRSFNNFEKSILRFMVNHPEPQDVCTITLFTKFCGCYLIRWSKDFSTLDFVFNEKEDWMNVRNKIFDVVVLLQYLQANYFIGVFPSKLLEEDQIYDHDKYNIGGGEWPSIFIFEKNRKIRIKFKTETLKQFENSNVYTMIPVKINHEKTGIGEVIKKYSNSTYHVTQALKDYVGNNFQTQEDLHYKKNKNLTWIGIGTAIIIGVISSILQIIQ